MKCSNNKHFFKRLLFVLSLMYPFAVYFLRETFSYSCFGVFLIVVLILRAFLEKNLNQRFLFLMISGIMGTLFFWNDRIAVHLYPVIVSLSFAAVLGWTLIYPPSLIERFARIFEGDLDARGVVYTRKVTILWLLFCVINAGISLATLLIDNPEIWMLYNGLISYVLIGIIMGSEYLFRIYYKRHGS